MLVVPLLPAGNVVPDVLSGRSHKGRDYTNCIVIESSRPFLLTADMVY